MSRSAHLWFLVGVFASAAIAIVGTIALAAIGAMNTAGEIAVVVSFDVILAVFAVQKVLKWHRVRQRMHERVSRELRCPESTAQSTGH